MKRFAEILMAATGLATVSAPAIFARRLNHLNCGRERRERPPADGPRDCT
jgi:hypothetical protein